MQNNGFSAVSKCIEDDMYNVCTVFESLWYIEKNFILFIHSVMCYDQETEFLEIRKKSS